LRLGPRPPERNLESEAEAVRIRPATASRPFWAQTALPAAIAACVACVITLGFAWRLAQRQADWTQLPNLKLASLEAQDPQPKAAIAHMVWDRDSDRCVVFFDGMKPPPDGKIYELWLVADKPRRAATFSPDSTGRARVAVTIPADIAGRVSLAAVTDEPVGGTDAPTGSYQLKGAIN
jgi:anti-sigma-K factor RskA